MNRKLILQYGFAMVLIAFLIYKANPLNLLDVIQRANPGWLLLSGLLFIAVIIYTSLSLRILFNVLVKIPFFRWIRYYIPAYSFGMVLPGKLGEFSIAYFLKKENIRLGESLAIMLMEKIISLIVAVIIAFFGFKLLFVNFNMYYYLVAILFLICCGIFALSKHGRFIAKKMLGKYALTLSGFSSAVSKIWRLNKCLIFINGIMLAIRFFFIAFVFRLYFLALGLDIPLIQMVPIFAITALASLLPITPNGIGVRESIGVALFIKLGVAMEFTLGAFMLDLLFNYITAILGICFFSREIRGGH